LLTTGGKRVVHFRWGKSAFFETAWLRQAWGVRALQVAGSFQLPASGFQPGGTAQLENGFRREDGKKEREAESGKLKAF
jgi:hypothetical protein